MPRAKRHIQVRHTVLVVVEGDTEFAFCRHLKASGSHGRNIQVTIKNAHGGSPEKIVEFARRQARQSSYDEVVIVFDDDCALSPRGERTARAMRASVVRFAPCIEGFFLRLLGRTSPSDSASCKACFHQNGLDEKAKLDHDSYERLFPIARLDEWMVNHEFARLWKTFTNTNP
jgi:hypothetical protein